MASFEITVNGELRFVNENVRTITIVADPVSAKKPERVYVHVGIGEAGEYAQYFDGDLRPGDNVSVRVVEEEQETELPRAMLDYEYCSFCRRQVRSPRRIVVGPCMAICVNCTKALRRTLLKGAPLPEGFSILGESARCGFCRKSPPEVPGLFGIFRLGICPECLRICHEMGKNWSE